MASSHHGDNEYLPVTWPFRAAGTVMILATVWFCTGWGIRDLSTAENPVRLSNHMPVFWAGVLLTVVLVVVGGVLNVAQSRRRAAAEHH
jgi:predicted anti-sigma-YlaC factor YlaD